MKNETQLKIKDILEEMIMVYKNDERPWIIGYSGGKDSTTVVQLVFTMLVQLPEEERHKDVYVVSSNTLIENPVVLGYLKHTLKLINNGAEAAGIPLYTHMVHPQYDNTYWTNIIGKGFPTPTSVRFRWCTERLKIKPSNTFIEEKVKENGEVVVLLGVRKAESIARSIRIKKREIEGYLLTPHVTLANTYVYNPIVNLTTDDIWEVLLSNNGSNPWGDSNNDLFLLYKGADGGECPFTTTSDKDTPTCGSSRLGCWICTVVSKDKSLTGFIENGETWLQALLDFRKWIISIRNKHEYRKQYRRDGNHYYKRLYLDKLPLLNGYIIDSNHIFVNDDGESYIDLKNCQTEVDKGKIYTSEDKDKVYLELLPVINIESSNDVTLEKDKIQEDEKGKFINMLGYGSFNFVAKQEILKKLLLLQKHVNNEYEIELITTEELKVIDEIWDNEEDLTHRTLVDLYYEIMGKRLPWDEYKKPMFDEKSIIEISNLCDKHNLDQNLINKLLIETNKYKHFANKFVLDKSINKILNQKRLHKEIEEIKNTS